MERIAHNEIRKEELTEMVGNGLFKDNQINSYTEIWQDVTHFKIGAMGKYQYFIISINI